MFDGLRLVILYGYRSFGDSESLLDYGCTDNNLLPLLKKGTEVGSKVRLTFAAIDNQHLTCLARRRA